MKRPAVYLLALSIPASFLPAVGGEGGFRWFTVLYAFGILPLIELALAPDRGNPTGQPRNESRLPDLFDLILWSVVPVQIFCLHSFLLTVQSAGLSTFELSGLIASMGILCGVLGINAAHELGHRRSRFERILSRLLLTTSLYWQFYVEHNRGHHKNVATPEDSESAAMNESLPAFWWRSLRTAYFNAWRIDAIEMFLGTLVQLGLVAMIHSIYGGLPTFAFLTSALIGALLLQAVNYIEHYGLRRLRLPEGGYERVLPVHSWNSDHPLSRAVLFELSRHSDHHANANRKYQSLRHFDHSPQMPTGYPGMILIALVPPLWFRIMNPHLERELNRIQKPTIST